jgi:uncharacterized protein YjbJ (UPF0337 family)
LNQTATTPFSPGNQKETVMVDENRVEGVAHQIKGAIKEAIGKVTGDTKTEAEGTAEKTGGKVQDTFGSAKDTAKDILNK